jgi:hypothetical protein
MRTTRAEDGERGNEGMKSVFLPAKRKSQHEAKEREGERQRTDLVALILILLIPVNPLAVHIGRLTANERLERPLQDRRPRKIPLRLILHPLIRPVEVIKVPLVLAPLVPFFLRRANGRRRLELNALAGTSWRRTGTGTRGDGREGSGGVGSELGGEETTASDAFRVGEAGTEVGEVAVLVEGNPPASKREVSLVKRKEQERKTHQKLWKW